MWLLLVGAGMWWLTHYSNRPGVVGQPPVRWPEQSGLTRDDRLTLVTFFHPRCPCSRASVNELAVLMAQCDGQVDAKAIFLQPSGADATWYQTDLWHSADRIPGVQVIADLAGQEMRRFGVATSGQALLYDPEGKLIFRGGITGSRGHAGDNLGRSTIGQLVRGAAHGDTAAKKFKTSCVFGCPLFD